VISRKIGHQKRNLPKTSFSAKEICYPQMQIQLGGKKIPTKT